MQRFLGTTSDDSTTVGPILQTGSVYSFHIIVFISPNWDVYFCFKGQNSLEKTLMLGKIEGGRRRGQQRMRWLDGITDPIDMSEQAPGVGDRQESLACCSPWDHKESDTTERLN